MACCVLLKRTETYDSGFAPISLLFIEKEARDMRNGDTGYMIEASKERVYQIIMSVVELSLVSTAHRKPPGCECDVWLAEISTNIIFNKRQAYTARCQQ